MTLLGIDTALGACSAALLRGGDILARRYEAMERGHAERLFPMLREIFAEAGISYAGIDRIAVTVGPGSFTGTRVGLAAARGIALAAGRRVSGVTTFEAVRAGAVDLPAGGYIGVLFDARRGGLYGQLFDAVGTACVEPFVAAPDELTSRFGAAADSRRPLFLLGTGAEQGLRALAGWEGGVRRAEGMPLPDAANVARLGADREPASTPPAPLYLRLPDAVPVASAPATP